VRIDGHAADRVEDAGLGRNAMIMMGMSAMAMTVMIVAGVSVIVMAVRVAHDEFRTLQQIP
jgi:hypothetical protein